MSHHTQETTTQPPPLKPPLSTARFGERDERGLTLSTPSGTPTPQTSQKPSDLGYRVVQGTKPNTVVSLSVCLHTWHVFCCFADARPVNTNKVLFSQSPWCATTPFYVTMHLFFPRRCTSGRSKNAPFLTNRSLQHNRAIIPKRYVQKKGAKSASRLRW